MAGNMLLTIGAIIIFGIFLCGANKLMIGNNQIAAQNEYYLTALSLAQSIIDEAKDKAFDQATVGTAISTRAPLAAPGLFGPDGASEAVPFPDTLCKSAPYSATNPGYWSAIRFNDVDDYQGYYRLVNTPRAEGYKLRVSLTYVNETAPDVPTGTRQFTKKMTVSVTSPYFPKIADGAETTVPDTLKLSYVFSY